jgi:RNA polymerase sigma factor (sigma-70 family)
MAKLRDDPPGDDPDALFARARAGDDSAWKALFDKCYPKVVRVVRRKLNPPMRSLYDSTDFASDVMKSLAANADRLDFPSFSSLMAFLVNVAEQKVIDEYRKVHNLKRDINRNRPLLFGHGGEGDAGMIVANDPTASQVALATEAHALLLEGKSPPEQTIIQMREQGYSPSEIAQQSGWNVRKVQRFFKDLRESFGRP